MQQERLLAKAFRYQTASHCLFQQIRTIQASEHPIPAHSTHAITQVCTRWWTISLLSYLVYLNASTPSLKRATWPLALNIDTQDRCPLIQRMFCGHNMELSCAAASPCTSTSTNEGSTFRRNSRRQLQRFVTRLSIILGVLPV
jgi:hypothetical protein